MLLLETANLPSSAGEILHYTERLQLLKTALVFTGKVNGPVTDNSQYRTVFQSVGGDDGVKAEGSETLWRNPCCL